MYTIFVEYKVRPDDIDAYKQEIKQIQQSLPTSLICYERLEAMAQAHQYVERIVVDNLEVYQVWKEELQKEQPDFPWTPILPYIQGGKDKLKMWAFRKID